MKFKCKDCDYVTSQSNEFHSHVKKIHGKVGSFKCVKCGFKTKERTELDDHITNEHSKIEANPDKDESSSDHKDEFSCFKCGINATSEEELIFHLETEYGNEAVQDYKRLHRKKRNSSRKPEVETNAPVRFTRRSLRSSTNNGSNNLDVQEESKVKRNDIVKREKPVIKAPETKKTKHAVKESESFNQDEENMEVVDLDEEEEETEERGESKALGCKLCSFKADNSKILLIHSNFMHKKMMRKSACKVCSKEFNGKKAIMKHMLTHMDLSSRKCSICEKTFCSIPLLRSHLKNIHTKFSDLKCDQCDFSTKLDKSLSDHIESEHPNNDLLKCKDKECTFKTEDQEMLKLHEDTLHSQWAKRSLPTMKVNRRAVPLGTTMNRSNRESTYEDIDPASYPDHFIPCSINDCKRRFDPANSVEFSTHIQKDHQSLLNPGAKIAAPKSSIRSLAENFMDGRPSLDSNSSLTDLRNQVSANSLSSVNLGKYQLPGSGISNLNMQKYGISNNAGLGLPFQKYQLGNNLVGNSLMNNLGNTGIGSSLFPSTSNFGLGQSLLNNKYGTLNAAIGRSPLLSATTSAPITEHRCQQCPQRFSSQIGLDYHIQRAHQLQMDTMTQMDLKSRFNDTNSAESYFNRLRNSIAV